LSARSPGWILREQPGERTLVVINAATTFCFRGACRLLKDEPPALGGTSIKTDTADESDRPDVACDGLWLGGSSTTTKTALGNEQDQPDFEPSATIQPRLLSSVIVDWGAALLSAKGRSFLERRLF
jgi:hypothetical protein